MSVDPLAGIQASPDVPANGGAGAAVAPAGAGVHPPDTVSLLSIKPLDGTLSVVELAVPGRGRVNLVLGNRYLNYGGLVIAAQALQALYA